MISYTGDITDTLRGKRQIWRNENFGWISIPKNANMQFRHIMGKLKAKRLNIESFDTLPDVTVCVWRNPRTRLLSGLGECLSRRKGIKGLNSAKYTEWLEKLLSDPHQFDEHLEPQIVYTHSIAYTHVIKFENLLEESQKVFDPVLAKRFLNPGRTKKSKHTKESLDDIIKQNENLITDIIDKYYSLDEKIFQNTEILKDKENIIRL